MPVGNDLRDRLCSLVETLDNLACEVDDAEIKHPSYLGGFVRSASRLLLCVVRHIDTR